MRRLCRFSLPRDGFELLDLVLMLHAAHKALAVDRVAAVAGKAFAPVLRAAFELCGKVRLADERVQIERRLLPRAAVEVDAADLRSVRTALFALFRREGKLLNQTVELFPSEILGGGGFGGAPFTLSTPLMPLWLSWKKSLPPYRCTPSQARRRRDSSVVSSSTGWPASARCILSTQKWPVMTRPASFFASSMSVSAQSGVT